MNSSLKLIIIYIILMENFTIMQSKQALSQQQKNEDGYLFDKYFDGLRQQYFVDIGEGFRIQNNKRSEYLASWFGLYVDATQDFTVNQSFSIHLNAMVRDQTFLKSSHQSSRVISLTLKDLCRKYFLKRPILMRVEVGSAGFYSLQSNDWSNKLCVPDVIEIENTSKIQLLLASKNYTKAQMVNKRGIYIRRDRKDFYDKQIQKYTTNFIKSTREIAQKSLIQSLGQNQQFTSLFYIHPIPDSVISIPDQSDLHHLTQKHQNTQALVIDFDLNNQYLYLGSSNYTVVNQKTSIKNYFHIIINYSTKNILNLFVLNFQNQLKNVPKIIDRQVTCKKKYKELTIVRFRLTIEELKALEQLKKKEKQQSIQKLLLEYFEKEDTGNSDKSSKAEESDKSSKAEELEQQSEQMIEINEQINKQLHQIMKNSENLNPQLPKNQNQLIKAQNKQNKQSPQKIIVKQQKSVNQQIRQIKYKTQRQINLQANPAKQKQAKPQLQKNVNEEIKKSEDTLQKKQIVKMYENQTLSIILMVMVILLIICVKLCKKEQKLKQELSRHEDPLESDSFRDNMRQHI